MLFLVHGLIYHLISFLTFFLPHRISLPILDSASLKPSLDTTLPIATSLSLIIFFLLAWSTSFPSQFTWSRKSHDQRVSEKTEHSLHIHLGVRLAEVSWVSPHSLSLSQGSYAAVTFLGLRQGRLGEVVPSSRS